MRFGARREEGASTVELAIVLPMLLLLIASIAPLVKTGYEYMVVQRAVAHGVRFATRVDANATVAVPTRRPTQAQVKDFVSTAAEPLTLPAANVTVSPNPATTLPGVGIEVRATYTMNYGILATFVNNIKSVFFGGSAFPTSRTVTVSGRGREE